MKRNERHFTNLIRQPAQSVDEAQRKSVAAKIIGHPDERAGMGQSHMAFADLLAKRIRRRAKENCLLYEIAAQHGNPLMSFEKIKLLRLGERTVAEDSPGGTPCHHLRRWAQDERRHPANRANGPLELDCLPFHPAGAFNDEPTRRIAPAAVTLGEFNMAIVL